MIRTSLSLADANTGKALVNAGSHSFPGLSFPDKESGLLHSSCLCMCAHDGLFVSLSLSLFHFDLRPENRFVFSPCLHTHGQVLSLSFPLLLWKSKYTVVVSLLSSPPSIHEAVRKGVTADSHSFPYFAVYTYIFCPGLLWQRKCLCPTSSSPTCRPSLLLLSPADQSCIAKSTHSLLPSSPAAVLPEKEGESVLHAVTHRLCLTHTLSHTHLSLSPIYLRMRRQASACISQHAIASLVESVNARVSSPSPRVASR